ncbi:hypothetical protein [Tahibacter caeni]|uniref:hypothetical protein n=1 Tax=Tahibacter caeni TaxID=1453545 RepID=UPI0021485C66|nr:hypothetical protein [Tahibacter caeni]
MFNTTRIGAALLAAALGGTAAAAGTSSLLVGYGEGTTLDPDFGRTWINGNTLEVIPPAYACGRRIYEADQLTWIAFTHDESGVNPDQTVDVWLPRSGCPYPSSIVIERNAGEKADYLPPNPYTFPLEYALLETFHGSRWIDKFGNTKPLSVPQLPYTIKTATFQGMPAQLGNLKAQLVDGALQPRAYVLAQQLQTDAAELSGDLSARVALRRRTDLPDREAALRFVEDAASAQLAAVDGQLAAATRYARAGQYAEAYRAADLALAAMNAATGYVGEAEGLIDTDDE